MTYSFSKNQFLIFGLALSALASACGPAAEEEIASSEDSARIPVLTIIFPWEARHGLTSAQYQAAFDELGAQGYRLTHVSGYNVDGAVRFAAIWEKKTGPAMVARHNMTSAQYQTEFDSLAQQGYRLTVLDGYESNGQARYAAIWEQKSGPAWTARHGMTGSQYQAEFTSMSNLGFRLTSVQGYGVGGTIYYAAVWEQKSGPAMVARHGMSAATYQSEFDNYSAQGYRLTHLSTYNIGSTDYYAAIWEMVSTRAWTARHRMTGGGYQHEFVDRKIQGYRLKKVDGYAIGTSARYGAIWEAEPNAPTGNYCKNGWCFDLERFADGLQNAYRGNVVKYGFEVRRGLSVIQRAAGPKRTSADAPAGTFTVFDRFNPASVSKSVTGVAAVQLLSRRGISLDAPIWTFLPSSWDIPANNRTITFKQVLNHTSGLRNGNAGGNYYYENVMEVMEHPISLADKVPSYANINYALLRVLVASLDGYSDWGIWASFGSASHFTEYVNEDIFSPLGIYDVRYEATGSAPTLFYPDPPGSANGTAYGDWSLKPGSAGSHVSVHELAVFGAATFNGMLLDDGAIDDIKEFSLNFGDYGALPDGSPCFGKGGYFPGSSNGGAELHSVLVHCDNGVDGMLVVNGEVGAGAFMEQLRAAFVPQ